MGNFSCPGYNQTVKEQCWFPTPLGDLRQENEEVAAMLRAWISDLVSSYNVDGLRLDTADFMPLPFLKTFRKAAGVPILGETTTYNVSYGLRYAQAISSILNFPVFFHLKTAFAAPGTPSSPASFAPLAAARSEQLQKWRESPVPVDINILGNFVDNHDGARFLKAIAQNDTAILRNGLAWAFFSPGLPIVYYGTEQSFNQDDNRYSLWPQYDTGSDMYRWIAHANELRRELGIVSFAAIQCKVNIQHFETHITMSRSVIIRLVVALVAAMSPRHCYTGGTISTAAMPAVIIRLVVAFVGAMPAAALACNIQALDSDAEDILVADATTLAFARGTSLIVATNVRATTSKGKGRGAPLWCVSGVGLWARRIEASGCKQRVVDALGSWRAKSASESCSSAVSLELSDEEGGKSKLCMVASANVTQERARQCAREPVVAVCEK